MLKVVNIKKSYGTKQVLKGVNFTFDSGKVYGIVGKNGAGKTTLFKCLAGLESYEGEVTSDFDNLRHHMGFLYTHPIIMSYITGWEYLKQLCTARGIHFDNFEEQNIFDLPLGEYAINYSTGMTKKLAFLGILLQQNDIFILDEPFNGVDIQSNMILSAIIAKLKEKNKTIIISSHIFSSLQENCDQICLLDNGTINEQFGKDDFQNLEDELKRDIVQDTLNGLNL